MCTKYHEAFNFVMKQLNLAQKRVLDINKLVSPEVMLASLPMERPAQCSSNLQAKLAALYLHIMRNAFCCSEHFQTSYAPVTNYEEVFTSVNVSKAATQLQVLREL